MRVVIVQRRLTAYRVPFFQALRSELRKRDIELSLVYGNPTPDEALKNDSGRISWGDYVPCKYFMWRLCWQNPSKISSNADLLILTSENKLLWNSVAQYLGTRAKIAFWGHGANFQGSYWSLREMFKRWTMRHVDWWFGYTELSLKHIERSGFPSSRITIVNNTVDISASLGFVRSIAEKEIIQTRREVGVIGKNVAVYVGSLYAEKKIGFLLAAAVKIRAIVPDFELIVIGAGEEQDRVIGAAKGTPWIKYLGAKSGREKMACIAASKLMLNPGLVGLGILDAFAAGVPVATTDCGLHSPEICYVKHGVNGLITANDLDSYVSGCVNLMADANGLRTMGAECIRSAEGLGLEQMVSKFADGIQACLSHPKYWRGSLANFGRS